MGSVARTLGFLWMLPFVSVACDDDDDSSSPPAVASVTIGPEGGSLQVTSGSLAGTSLTIPPGALTSPVAFSIFEDSVSLVPGFVDVGPAVHIEPSIALALPALLTLPFDPARVPAPTTSADFVVRMRDTTGMVSEGAPETVDEENGLARVEVLEMVTWWVSVPDTIDTRAYLPLAGGDVYEYDSGLRLAVDETRTEPNFLGLPLTKLTFSYFSNYTGFYLTESTQGALGLFGEFEIAYTNRQERLASAVPLLQPVESVGAVDDAFYSFIGFVPYGSPVPFYMGSGHTFASIAERTSVATPAGGFDDVVRLELATERSDSRPNYSTITWRLWLANGVGPVQVQLGNGPLHRLVEATVGGVVIE
jgi:hypothetical protein